MAGIQIEENTSPQEEGELRHSPEWLGFGLIAIFVAGVLAMVATWFLVAYYPIPNDDAIHLGLLVPLFVVFFDFLLIYRLAGSKTRQGQRMAAIKWSVSLLLLGLLAASVLGSLPLLWRRFMTAIPGLREVPWVTIFMLWVAADNLWRRRRPSRGNRSYPRGWLIVQGSSAVVILAANLVLTVVRFSGGEAWLGALYLAVALLFGVLAAFDFIELWQRRRDKPTESIAQDP